MKILIALVFLLALTSCGRSKDNDCNSKESMRMECQVINTPNYGTYYVRELCNRTYAADRCY